MRRYYLESLPQGSAGGLMSEQNEWFHARAQSDARPGIDDKRVLAGARQQWAARPFPDYIFETRRDCFCRSEEIGPSRITVRQGVITHVTSIETGAAVVAADWYTIEQLFERIPQLAEQNGVEDVAVEYDSALGYPSSIAVRYEEGILDAGILYVISAVEAAP